VYDLYGPPAVPTDFCFWALIRCRCVKHLWAAKAQILIGLEVEKGWIPGMIRVTAPQKWLWMPRVMH